MTTIDEDTLLRHEKEIKELRRRGVHYRAASDGTPLLLARGIELAIGDTDPTALHPADIGILVQAHDGDLDSIAALATTSFGRSLLTMANAAALRGAAVLGTVATLDSDTDGTLAANSNGRIPTQAAVKTYADQILSAANAEVFKGIINCSANPNYPAANAGDHYVVSVDGKIGGASGAVVEAGDGLLCIVDGTSAGTQAAVGANWIIIQKNIDGAVTGPVSAVNGNLPSFSGTGGKIIQDSGFKAINVSTDNEKAAIAGTTGAASNSNRSISEQGPRADLPMNSHRITQLLEGFDTHDAATIGQLFQELLAGLSGFLVKRPVYACTIATLPAHSRSGNTLEATANGTLTSAFGAAAASFTAGAFISKFTIDVDTTYGMATDSSGNTYVGSLSTDKVKKYNSSGVEVTTGGFPIAVGSGVLGLDVDASGNIFLTTNNGEVMKYNSSGIRSWSSGSTGSGNGEFYNPLDLAIDSSGNIFVIDTLNNRVQKLNSSGIYQSKFGTPGSGDGEFSIPWGIDIDGSDNIFVADADNHRIQKFNSSGVYQSKFGSNGSGNGQFAVGSLSLTIDGSDNIFVVDAGNNRIQKFNSSGVYQSQFGSSGSGNGQFNLPTGIDTDSSGNVVVNDGSGNSRIERFSASVTTVAPDLLVRHEGSGSHLENGIYTLDDPGSGGSHWIMTRRDDADDSGEIVFGALITAYREDNRVGGRFLCATTGPIDINTTAMQWDRQSGMGVDYGMVTALPSGALPSDRCTYCDSITSPTYTWNLIYDGTKWDCVGGTPMVANVNTTESRNANSYAALTTAGPSVTVPLAGDYGIQDGSDISGLAAAHGYHSYDVGGTGAVDADAARFQYSIAGTLGGTVIGSIRTKTGLAAGTAIVSKYKAAVGTVFFQQRWICVMPRRVS